MHFAQRPVAYSCALYAERDGIAIGWNFADNLPDAAAARALLDTVRDELVNLNDRVSGRAPGTCYIHLLQHRSRDCDCLTEAAPDDACTVLQTFAPQPNATEEENHEATLDWLGAYSERLNVGWLALTELVHDSASAEASEINNGGERQQLGYLLRQLGQSQLTAELVNLAEPASEDGAASVDGTDSR